MSGKNILYLSVEDFFLQPIYSCIHCRANLAHHTDLISKSFQGSQGRAYLFNNVVNVGILVAEERMLLTGLHYVADIYCECCSFILGWKYERAFEPNQRYKEGKYIIELANLIKDNGWDVDYPRMRHSYSKENRKSFSIDWEQSCDSISRNSLTKQCITKTKNNFIKDLSRDFQYLFGFYDKQNAKIENSVPRHIDVIEFSEDISNSVMTTSLEGHGASDLRLNSDSDNLESLNNSVNQSGVHLSVDLILKSGQDILNLSTNESPDNSSLNTSYSSSKGLLGATCSSDVKFIDVQTRKMAKSSKSKKSSDSCTNTTQYLPSNESLSVIASGTSCLSNLTNQHRHTRHKYKSRHSSNVVNPQKTIVHRRHRSTEQSEEVAHAGNDSLHGTNDQHNHHSSNDKRTEPNLYTQKDHY